MNQDIRLYNEKLTPTYAVTIPNPCHENWELMTPQEQGRHCKVCNKVVTDFTTMTNEEIIRYLQSTKESICGRIEDEQLQFLQPYIPLSKQAKLFLYALAIAFFTQVPLNVFSQELQDSARSTQMQYGQLTGRVTDEKGNPVYFATVRVMQGDIVVGGGKTDENGNFLIHSLKPGWYNLSVSFYGYYGEEWQGIRVDTNKSIVINFNLDKKTINKEKVIKVGGFNRYHLDPSNPARKGFNKSDIRHMGG